MLKKNPTVYFVFMSPSYSSLLLSSVFSFFLSIKIQRPLWKLLQAGQVASNWQSYPFCSKPSQSILLLGPAHPSVHNAHKSISCRQSCLVASLCSHRCHPTGGVRCLPGESRPIGYNQGREGSCCIFWELMVSTAPGLGFPSCSWLVNGPGSQLKQRPILHKVSHSYITLLLPLMILHLCLHQSP